MRKWILVVTFSMVTLTAFSKNVTLTIRCPDQIKVDYKYATNKFVEIDYTNIFVNVYVHVFYVVQYTFKEPIQLSTIHETYLNQIQASLPTGSGYGIIEVRCRKGKGKKLLVFARLRFSLKKDTTVQIIPSTDTKGKRTIKIEEVGK